MDPHALGETLRSQTWLDSLEERAHSAVSSALEHLPDGVEPTLHGEFMGHPVHPAAVTLPIGALGSTVVLDTVAGATGNAALDTGADATLAIGLLSALPASALGWADWARIEDRGTRRLGLIHATTNVIGLAAFAGSWVARRKGNRKLGRKLAVFGMAVMTGGAYLGGKLAYEYRVGVKD
ncbi:DUF2231 domain-containing protein [bacterium]|nr:MAG: DUF2231 domain-containing protein [bacterium]